MKATAPGEKNKNSVKKTRDDIEKKFPVNRKEKTFRNPIIKVCAEIIRQSRISYNKTHEEFAKLLNVKSSYLKSIEAGIFPLAPANALSLFDIWQQIDEKYKKFTLKAVIQLLTLVSITESYWQESKRKMEERFKGSKITLSLRNSWHAESLKNTVLRISNNKDSENNRIKKLLHPFLSRDLFDPSNIDFDLKKLVPHIEDFLINYEFFGLSTADELKKRNREFSKLFGDVSSFYTEFLVSTAEQLRLLPVKFDIINLSTWEKSHSSEFRRMYVLIDGNYNPSNKREFETYPFDFILGKNFTCLHFLFTNTETDTKLIQKDFIREFQNRYSKQDDSECEKILFEKVKFNIVETGINYRQLLEAGTERYQIFWLIQLDYLIGFVANESHESKRSNSEDDYYRLSSARSLTNNETFEKYQLAVDVFKINNP